MTPEFCYVFRYYTERKSTVHTKLYTYGYDFVVFPMRKWRKQLMCTIECESFIKREKDTQNTKNEELLSILVTTVIGVTFISFGSVGWSYVDYLNYTEREIICSLKMLMFTKFKGILQNL